MKTLTVTVTKEHANDGIPGEADSCAVAIALHIQASLTYSHLSQK